MRSAATAKHARSTIKCRKTSVDWAEAAQWQHSKDDSSTCFAGLVQPSCQAVQSQRWQQARPARSSTLESERRMSTGSTPPRAPASPRTSAADLDGYPTTCARHALALTYQPCMQKLIHNLCIARQQSCTWMAPSGMSSAQGAEAAAAARARRALSSVKRSAPPGALPTSVSPRPRTSSTYARFASPVSSEAVRPCKNEILKAQCDKWHL